MNRHAKVPIFWLTTPPNIWNGTAFQPAVFRSLLKFHCSIPLMTEPSSCPDCGNLQDIHGAHALSCRVASGSIDQHDSIVMESLRN